MIEADVALLEHCKYKEGTCSQDKSSDQIVTTSVYPSILSALLFTIPSIFLLLIPKHNVRSSLGTETWYNREEKSVIVYKQQGKPYNNCTDDVNNNIIRYDYNVYDVQFEIDFCMLYAVISLYSAYNSLLAYYFAENSYFIMGCHLILFVN